MRISIPILVYLLSLAPVAAITWADGEQSDPFKEGAKCDAPELMSMGGYVYQWPSRFDLVFEPWVDWIWRCRESGYLSYARDFDKLPDAEKARIGDFLKTHPWQKKFEEDEGRQEELDQMEAIYALRDRTLTERAYLLRARAWLYGKDPMADQYREKALAIHKEILTAENPEGIDLIENLYLVGFYTWKLGSQQEADRYFQEARAVRWKDAEDKSQVGNEYINTLIDEVKAGEASDDKRFRD